MPVGYGSNFPLPLLSATEVGVWINPGRPNLGWLSILLNVIEVGASLFLGPEVGTAIALANAGAQTGINYAETGKVDAVGAGINFASAIIPGITQAIKGARYSSFLEKPGAIIEHYGNGNSIQLGIDKAIDMHPEFGLGTVPEGIHTGLKEAGHAVGDTIYPGASQAAKDWQTFANGGTIHLGRMSDFAARTKPDWGNELLNKLVDPRTKSISYLSRQGRLDWVSKQRGFIAPLKDTSGKLIHYTSEQWAAKTEKEFRAAFRGVQGVGETATDIGADTENKILRSIQEDTGLFFSEINRLKGLIRDGKIINLKLYRSILERAFARTGNSLLESAILGSKQGKFMKLITNEETTAMKIARISSKTMQFSTKVGGYITSPSSLAADAVSKTVAKLTSKVEAIGEELAGKMAKWIKMGAKGMAKVEDEFERTGGNLLTSSWILGYKLLEEDAISSTILIQFKNQHPNVITKVSESELLAFLEAKSKGNWYINNIARSRGGRRVSELGVTGKLENMLGMLPIGQINEIIGFASFGESFITQIRAGSGTMIWQTGKYMEGFKDGFIQGVISEGIKGAVALGTRNQYAKQVLEGGFGSVASGTSFGTAFSSSFASGAQSMKDTIFEDTTKSGSIVKNVKVIQGTGSSLKGII